MDLFNKEDLRTLIESGNGQCISFFLPTYRAGKQIQQNSIRFKNLLREAEKRLHADGVRRPALEELFEPALELLENSIFWQHQSDGLAAFLSPQMFRYYRLPIDFEELVIVASRFHIKPLLQLFTGDGRFYVLALSQNDIRLLQGTRTSVSEIDLQEAPSSLSEALKYDDPQSQLQYHTGSRQPGGGKPSEALVYHGQGVGIDEKKTNLRRYFQQVDKGVVKVLQNERAPLILAGVENLHPIYREANTYPFLVDEGITGNPEELSSNELHKQAWDILHPRFLKAFRESAEKYQELAGTDRQKVSHEVQKIVPAAYYGRVETLFVATHEHQWGRFDAATKEIHLNEDAGQSNEDLLDFAAVQTLLHGGTVYAVEADDMPDEHKALVAIYRY